VITRQGDMVEILRVSYERRSACTEARSEMHASEGDTGTECEKGWNVPS
jgi:hypothetical protein